MTKIILNIGYCCLEVALKDFSNIRLINCFIYHNDKSLPPLILILEAKEIQDCLFQESSFKLRETPSIHEDHETRFSSRVLMFLI